MSYGADVSGHLPARRILRGQDPERAKPADLPVEQPTKFELVINLKTAKQIGLTIPPERAGTGGPKSFGEARVTVDRGHRMGRCSARVQHKTSTARREA